MNSGVQTVHRPDSQSQTQHESRQPMSGPPVALHVAPELGLWLQEPQTLARWDGASRATECPSSGVRSWSRRGQAESRVPISHFSFGDHEAENPRND